MNSCAISFLTITNTLSRHLPSAATSPPKSSRTLLAPRHIRSPPTVILAAKTEIRVCTNRTCRRQGSAQTLEVLTGIAPPDVSVVSCGCLSRCGAGPNVVVLPDAAFVGHCGTAARASEVMMSVCGVSDGGKSLEAFGLRKRAEDELGLGNLSQAEILLSKALELQAFGGVHIIYKVRSTVRLASGNHLGALEDANEALTLAPLYVEGDALLASDRFDAAEKSYTTALELDPTLRRSKSFKARVSKLEEKVAAVAA
uniref:Uncharacterized protein n=1 Tax=Kalanchoe fedtschenkoi TaxID=63787 RepID=A0A7N0U4G1_KALFE